MNSYAPNAPTVALPLGRRILYMALVMLGLAILATILTLPGGVGVEDFLGFGPRDRDELGAIEATWIRLQVFQFGSVSSSVNSVAVAYLSFDTIFLIPLYGTVFLEIARQIARSPEELIPRISTRATSIALAVLTTALMAVDLVENTSGLAKLAEIPRAYDPATGLYWPAIVAAVVSPWLGFQFWKRVTGGEATLRGLGETSVPGASAKWSLAMAAGLLVAVVALGASFLAPLTSPVELASQYSHAGKVGLSAVAVLFLLVLGLAWLFLSPTSHDDRGAIRRGIADILLRVRYVLIVLAVLIGLTLVLTQCLDISIGLADALQQWPEALLAFPSAALAVLAVWALSFSCWLWARLVCRMRGPGGRASAHSGPVDAVLQTAARSTARILSLVPPFAAAVLNGQAARDAIWAASYEKSTSIISPLLLIVFGAASLLGGLLFLWNRERVSQKGLEQPERYYDDPKLSGDDWMAAIAAEKYHFIGKGGPGPTVLAVVALAAAVAVRCLVALTQPGVPLGYVVIVLTLVAWLGLLGWLSLKERREARPWALLIIGVAAVLGYLGFTENHIVRVARSNVSAELPAAGLQVLGAILLLVVVAATAYVLVRNVIQAEANRAPRLRWGWVVTLAAVVSVAVLFGIDRVSSRPPQANAVGPRQQLEAAFTSWTSALWENPKIARTGSPRVFFVTSAGGGIRAAFWTARALEQLRLKVPEFDARTFMMSGVSGGSVGEAVYAACLRQEANGAGKVGDCISRFGDHDLLTPMVGAWLFEDALARVLPTSLPRWLAKPDALCTQPGCGFLSRGLWFEQAMERSIPEMRAGIAQTARAGGASASQLFLNSTWVESGDRAIASGVVVDWRTDFPEARDQLAVAGCSQLAINACDQRPGSSTLPALVDIPLSAAAHNSGRFTFVNAIGVLRTASAETSGHLADGGYFDNWGSHTAIDVLGAFRTWIMQRCPQSGPDEFCVWLRSLRPTIFVIQNGVTVNCALGASHAAEVECLKRQWSLDPNSLVASEYDVAQPTQTARLALFADLAGPLVTAVNVGGTGGNGRRAAALLEEACFKFRSALQPASVAQAGPRPLNDCTISITQRADGVDYPLGWYLSPTARDALGRQAATEVPRQLYCFARDEGPAVPPAGTRCPQD
jgi:hypothetical protein